jgi:hypothetical protein
MASDDLTIRGNHDRWVSGPDPARMSASDRYAYHQLTVRVIAIGFEPCRPPLMRIMEFSRVTAHPTINISLRKPWNADWCVRLHPLSGRVWAMFGLAWFCVGIATNSIWSNCPMAH